MVSTTEPTILDGHHRYEICTRLGIAFETVQAEACLTREAAIAWIITNQLGRRNLTPSQRAAFSPEWERQLAVEAKKRQGQRTDLQEIFPESDEGVQ